MKAYIFHRGALPRDARTLPMRDFARQYGTQNRFLVSNSEAHVLGFDEKACNRRLFLFYMWLMARKKGMSCGAEGGMIQ